MIEAHSPRTLAEAFAILAERRDSIKIIAGGTDLMVLLNARQLDAQEFLDIWRLDELRGVDVARDFIRIGALTTYTEIIKSLSTQKHVPSLVAASRTIGALQIQNRGTLGGNVVNGSPAGDSLPVLAVYDAVLEIGSGRRTRLVGFNDFYTGYRKNVLKADELLLAIRIPKLQSGERDFFRKVGTRRAQAISKMVMAAKVQASNGAIESVSIGIGSVAPTVLRARATERLLGNSRLTNEVIERARQTIANEIAPITDLRSTEHYRRTVTGNVLLKFLRDLRK